MRRMLHGAVLGALVSLLAGEVVGTGVPTFLYTAAPRYDPANWDHGGERFLDGAQLVLRTGTDRRNLAPGFFASADPVVSTDGRQVLFAGRPSKTDRWQLWQVDLAGGQPARVWANSDSCIRPLFLPDGRIAYTRVTPGGSAIEVVRPENGKVDVLTHAPGWYLTDDILRDGRILFEWRGDLFSVYPDGTGVESFRCDHGPQRSRGRQVSSGDIVFDVAGGLARFTSALTFQQKLPPANLELGGPVAEVAPGRWLVTARPRSSDAYAIYETEPHSMEMRRVESQQGINAVEPTVVAPRTPPRDFPSALVPTRKTGNLLCLDAKESKDPIEGKIHSVRLYTLGAGGKPQVLGETAVASDGSFYVEVPADRPLRMELLNAAGVRLRGEEHWFWMRPSEQRICVGCHTGPERAPENKVPEILNETLVPVKMLGDNGRPQ